MTIDPLTLPEVELAPSSSFQLALMEGGRALECFELGSPTWREGLLVMAVVHDLHLGSIDALAGAEQHQHHRTVVELKHLLETRYLGRLRCWDETFAWPAEVEVADPVDALRAIAALDRVPAVYEWAADSASRADLLAYLALEGGPDGGFDDLVAVCQVGLAGEPKLEMARNYWDELGRGQADHVHTELHRTMARSVRLAVPDREDQPTAALERSALGGLLATNRWLQPQMVGALGLIELQAGPRCRKVAAGLRRVGVPEEGVRFYDEHAVADPRHGKDWLEHVVRPLVQDPRWARGIVEGARWRWLVNARFFDHARRQLVPT